MRAGRIDGFVQPAVKNPTVKRHTVRCAPGAAGERSWSPSTATTPVVERVESVSQSDPEKLRALPPDILRWMPGEE